MKGRERQNDSQRGNGNNKRQESCHVNRCSLFSELLLINREQYSSYVNTISEREKTTTSVSWGEFLITGSLGFKRKIWHLEI